VLITPAKDMRFLIVGCGSIGKRHLRNLLSLGVKNIGALDVRPDRLKEARSQFPVSAYSDMESALDAGADAVVICTPPSVHLSEALAAARAGCHMFVEKPLAEKLEGVEELMKEVTERGLRTLVGCNFRFHPGLRFVKQLLGRGAIGKVVAAHARFGQYLPDWHPTEDYRDGYSGHSSLGGGVILDRIHEFDYLCWLFGVAREVSCTADHLSSLDIDTEDVAEATLLFGGGVVASVSLDYVSRVYKCELEIVGEGGSAIWSFQDGSVRWYDANKRAWQVVGLEPYDPNEMYVDEMKHFLAVLAGTEQSENDLDFARRTLLIALAAKQSAARGMKVRL